MGETRIGDSASAGGMEIETRPEWTGVDIGGGTRLTARIVDGIGADFITHGARSTRNQAAFQASARA